MVNLAENDSLLGVLCVWLLFYIKNEKRVPSWCGATFLHSAFSHCWKHSPLLNFFFDFVYSIFVVCYVSLFAPFIGFRMKGRRILSFWFSISTVVSIASIGNPLQKYEPWFFKQHECARHCIWLYCYSLHIKYTDTLLIYYVSDYIFVNSAWINSRAARPLSFHTFHLFIQQ